MTVPAHLVAEPTSRAPALAAVDTASDLDTATSRWLEEALAELMSAPLTSAQFDLIRRTFGVAT